jgi:rubrerythrin
MEKFIFFEKNDFENIINFAIDKEKEAIEIYENLKKKVSSDNLIAFIQNIIKMEQNHINKLKKLYDKKDIFESEVFKIQYEPSIFDFIKIKKDTNNLSNLNYQDILLIAIDREKKSYDLYNKLAYTFKNIQQLYNTFALLANEELSHKNFFENIYDKDILKEN